MVNSILYFVNVDIMSDDKLLRLDQMLDYIAVKPELKVKVEPEVDTTLTSTQCPLEYVKQEPEYCLIGLDCEQSHNDGVNLENEFDINYPESVINMEQEQQHDTDSDTHNPHIHHITIKDEIDALAQRDAQRQIDIQSSLLQDIPTSLYYHKCECVTQNSKFGINKKLDQQHQTFSCKICTLPFTIEFGLNTPPNIQIGEQSYTCDVCTLLLTQKSIINSYKRTHNEKKPYSCEFCTRSFVYKTKLVSHQKEKHNGEMKNGQPRLNFQQDSFQDDNFTTRNKQKCDFEKQYSESSINKKQQNQYYNNNTDSDTYTNEIKQIAIKQDIDTLAQGDPQQQIETPEQSTPESILEQITTVSHPCKCQLCPRSFTRKSNLVIHQRIHTGEKPYSCDHCTRLFSDKANLIQHMKIHSGVKPYSCEFCTLSFSLKSNLLKHQRIHTGEKPFSCEFCTSSFTEKSNLTQHRRIHTGEKPYSCEICTRSFNNKSSLIKHKKIHTSEKPYSCEFCTHSYTAKSYLKKHQIIHTGNKSY